MAAHHRSRRGGIDVSEQQFRLLPRVTDANRHFWQGGEHGRLQFQRCLDDGTWIHPPQPICPVCFGRNLGVDAVSGRAVVHCYTVNHKQWTPVPVPYVIAVVELAEQPGLRLTTNIVGCEPGEVHTGMEVEVGFEHYDDVWIPLFHPAGLPQAAAATGAEVGA